VRKYARIVARIVEQPIFVNFAEESIVDNPFMKSFLKRDVRCQQACETLPICAFSGTGS
jgi:hypothetical protein